MPASRRRNVRWMLAVLLLVLTFGSLFAAALGTSRPRADFVLNNGSEISTLDPQAATGIPDGKVLRAIYEGLTRKDPISTVAVPGVAESWELSEDRQTYTFHLRPDAKWSDGSQVVARDFEFTFRRLLDAETAAPYAYQLFCVRGAKAFHTGRTEDGRELEPKWKRVGIAALDELTLEVQLEYPVAYFLEMLANPPFFPVHRDSIRAAREAYPDRWQVEWLRPERLVTNGPFRIVERRLNDRIRLARSDTYWGRDDVAFRTIDILAVEHWSTALNMYLQGDIDWLDGQIPPALVDIALEREDFNPGPYLGIYFYRVNCTKPPLDQAAVRRALFQALPRKAIATDLLGAGQMPAASFVPWGRAGPYASPKAPPESWAAAVTQMKQAGYGEEGEAFPTIEILYNSSEAHRDIAELVAASWEEIGVDTRLAQREFKTYLDAQRNLEYDVSRSSWIGDFVDAINFLELFVSGGENNRTGWSDERYDALIEQARRETHLGKRVQILRTAESILLMELPVLPIYSYTSQNLVNPRLGGFHNNFLNEHWPQAWYWKDDAELREDRADLRPNKTLVKARGPRDGLYPPAGRPGEEADE